MASCSECNRRPQSEEEQALAKFIATTPFRFSPEDLKILKERSFHNMWVELTGTGSNLPHKTKNDLISLAKKTGPFNFVITCNYLGVAVPAISLSELFEFAEAARRNHSQRESVFPLLSKLGLFNQLYSPSNDADLRQFEKATLAEILSISDDFEHLYTILSPVVRKDKFADYPLPLQAILILSAGYKAGLTTEERAEQWRTFARSIKADVSTLRK